MKEISRQIVIFGDFKTIGFDIFSKILNIINKYNFLLDATHDFKAINGFNGLLQINSNTLEQQSPFFQPSMRPVLTTQDKHFSVFLGSSRIHVEENDSVLEDYDVFIEKAYDILHAIISQYNSDIYINRLALNGKILSEDAKKMSSVYASTFKDSILYGNSSEEFSFRINTKITSNSIGADINKIISYNRTNEILPTKEMKPIMIIDYDYNTVSKEDARYNIQDLSSLIKEGKSFRANII